MNKDILIIGVIVVACVGVTAIAFTSPGQAKPPALDVAAKPRTDPDLDRPRPGPIAKPPTTELSPPPGFNPDTNTGIDPLNPLGASPPAAGIDPITGRPVAARRDPWTTPGTPAPVAGPAFPPFPQPPAIPVPPPVGPADPAPGFDQPRTHVVAKGETGGDISMKHYGTTRNWPEIQKANPGVDPSALRIGQKLTIPVVAKREAVPTPGEAPRLDDGQTAYTVKKGDAFYTIAKSELGDATRHPEIAKLNPGVSSESLKVGQVIKLPPRAKPAEKPAPAAVDPGEPGGKVHVVKQGESLMDISMIHFGTHRHWREIEKANPGIDPNNLHVGQKLKLPDPPKELPKKAAAPVDPGSEPVITGDFVEHVVKEDEYLSDIARKHYGNPNAYDRIIKANPGLDAHRMRVGQKLRIPKASASEKAADKADKPVEATPAKPKPAKTPPPLPSDNPFAFPPPSPPGSGAAPGGSGFAPPGGEFAPGGATFPPPGPASGFPPATGADLWNTPAPRPAGGAPADARRPGDALDELGTQPRR